MQKFALSWWQELSSDIQLFDNNQATSSVQTGSTKLIGKNQAENRSTVAEMVQYMLDDKLTTGIMERSTYSKEITTLKRLKRHPLGEMDVEDVTEADCLAFFRYLIQDKGLALNTVRVSQLQLKSAYWYYLRERKTANNPMQFISLYPKQKAIPNAATRNESSQLFEALSELDAGSRYYTVIWLAFCTGMREAEIAALQWGNVFLDKGLFVVDHSIGKDDCHRDIYNDTYIKATKSRNSRIIPLNDFLATVLKNRFIYQTKERDGKQPTNATFVVGFPDDRYIRPQSISVWWQRFSKKHQLIGNQNRRLRFHDLRHSFASNMLSEGADVNSVASILGHSDPSITLSIYASPDTEAIKQAMNTAGLFKGFGLPQATDWPISTPQQAESNRSPNS